MADQEQKAAAQVVVIEEKTQPQTPPVMAAVVVEKEPIPVPESEEEPVKSPKLVEEDQQQPPAVVVTDEKMPESGSFKEESNKIADLLETERKALDEFKQLVREALNNHEFTSVSKKEEQPINEEPKPTTVADVVAVVDEDEKAKPEADEDKPVPEPVVDEPTKPETQESGSVVVEDDGVKTVEAIEETIVSAVQQDTESNPTLPQETEQKTEEKKPGTAEEVSIWGIPLLADERSDVVLLKFLRARDFKVKDSFTMLKNTIHWRKEFGIDELVEQDLGCGDDLKRVVFMHGVDKEGHPVCYNVYGEFQSKELYQKTFSDEEKRQNFLKWRIQFLEKSIRKLDFSPGAISTIVQVNDLKNSPGPAKWELRQVTKQTLQLLQDNYPEFVAKQVFINVPWWYLAVNKMISPFLTQRTRSKFVFAGPSKSAETLFRYISAEQVPVKYGGLSKDGEFAITDAVTEIIVKPAAKHTVEFPVTEGCELTWEVRVVGWEVSYGAEFVPSAEDSYTVIIQKSRKVGSNEEPVLCNNFKISEPGKVVLTIDNSTSKKKKLLYRLKTKSISSLIE